MTWYTCESRHGYYLKNENGDTWPPLPNVSPRIFKIEYHADMFIKDNNLNKESERIHDSFGDSFEDKETNNKCSIELSHYYSYLKIEIAKLNFTSLKVEINSIDLQDTEALEKLNEIANKIAERIEEQVNGNE